MLPPGHIAGGFLAAEALLKITKPDLPAAQINELLAWGALCGFLPDMDSFWAFAKEKSFTVRHLEENDHRQYISHAPIVWLAAGLLIYFLANNAFARYAGLILWLSSWSHFFLDTVEHGIMWLWPLSKKKLVIVKGDLQNIATPGFFGYWLSFLKRYSTKVSFYLELFILILACYVLIRTF